MARKSRQKPPAYTLHKSSGQARVRINGKDHYLGPHNSPESHQKYARLIAEWSVLRPSLRDREASPSLDDLSVAELLLGYLRYAEEYYVDLDGSPSKDLACMIGAMRPLKQLYATSLVRDFGPLSLKAVRKHMIGLGWARTHINRSINRIRRIFKWGVAEELVTPTVFQALKTVDGLRKGRTDARETDPIKPVTLSSVDAVLPRVSRQVAAMIRLQLLCGCRPGEVVVMRGRDVDTSGEIWIYSPHRHKTAWRGHQRKIYLGPESQAIVNEFISTDLEDYLFRPCDAMAEHRDRLTRSRRTDARWGNKPGTNRKRSPRKLPGQCYTPESYAKAIAAGCKKSFPLPKSLCKHRGEKAMAWKARLSAEQLAEVQTWQVAHWWSPNRLRHTTATEIRRQFGVEASQVVLGHTRADVTQVYAERNQKLAMDIMRQRG